MGLLKRLLREQKENGLLRRAVTLKNFEFDSGSEAEGKKKEAKSSDRKPSPILKGV
jgi:hypothetical protein